MPTAAPTAAEVPIALASFGRSTHADFERAYTQEVERFRALPPDEQERHPNPVKAGRKYLALGYAMALGVYFTKRRSKRPPPDPDFMVQQAADATNPAVVVEVQHGGSIGPEYP